MMEEGNAKELALINANYDAKILDIEKREKELLKALQDAEYERWKEQKITRKKDYSSLRPSQNYHRTNNPSLTQNIPQP